MVTYVIILFDPISRICIITKDGLLYVLFVFLCVPESFIDFCTMIVLYYNM